MRTNQWPGTLFIIWPIGFSLSGHQLGQTIRGTQSVYLDVSTLKPAARSTDKCRLDTVRWDTVSEVHYLLQWYPFSLHVNTNTGSNWIAWFLWLCWTNTCIIFPGNMFEKFPLWANPAIFLKHFHDACGIAMHWHIPVLRSDLNVGFAACHINHISPSSSYATMVFQHESPERPQLLANSSTPSARLETACVRSFFLFYYLVRLHVTWPHRQNWRGRELSLEKQSSELPSLLSLTDLDSCSLCSNTLCVRNQSGVIPDMSQQLSRGEPDGQIIMRAVYYKDHRSAVLLALT